MARQSLGGPAPRQPEPVFAPSRTTSALGAPTPASRPAPNPSAPHRTTYASGGTIEKGRSYYDPEQGGVRNAGTPQKSGQNAGFLAGPGYVAPTKQPQPFPSMPLDFSAFGDLTGDLGFGGGAGGAGAGGGAGGGAGAGGGPPGPASASSFQGSPSSYMEEVYRENMNQYRNAPDMLDNYITQGRDATTMALREAQQGLVGRLGSGASSPAAAARISDLAARNMNKAVSDAAAQKFGMQQQALGQAGTMGSGLAGDLRAQENMGINAYRATTDAWSAAQNADIARQKIGLDAQIAALNAKMGMISPIMNMYGNIMSSAYSNAFQPYRS